MVQADILMAAYLVVGSWRLFLLRLERTTWWGQVPQVVRIAGHYYTMLYVVFAFVILGSLDEVWYFNVNLQWLNPATFEPAPPEADPDELLFPPWLRILALGTPIATLGTFVVTSVHTGRHVRGIYRYGKGMIGENRQRDRAIQVLALPMVYGAMAFKSVLRMLSLFTGMPDSDVGGQTSDVGANGTSWTHAPRHAMDWNQRQQLELELYAANYQTADLYEAWALYQFARLCLTELKDWYRRELKIDTLELVTTVSTLTVQGVLSFVFVCLLNATFTISLATYLMIRASPVGDEHWPNEAPYQTTVEHVFVGMGLVSSTAAICNVVTVERTFHSQLHDLSPSSKFWSTKIMVSIAFIQEVVLSIIVRFSRDTLSELQEKLVYSSLICYEVFFVSLFHLYAWPEDEPWHHPNDDGRMLSRRRTAFPVRSLARSTTVGFNMDVEMAERTAQLSRFSTVSIISARSNRSA